MHNFQNAFRSGSQENNSNVKAVGGKDSRDDIDWGNYKSFSQTTVLTDNPAIFVIL